MTSYVIYRVVRADYAEEFLRCYRGGRIAWRRGQALATTFHTRADAHKRAVELALYDYTVREVRS